MYTHINEILMWVYFFFFNIYYKEYKVNGNGKVLSIDETGNNYKIIRLLINNKEVLVPYNEHFIKKIDSNKKTIEIELL